MDLFREPGLKRLIRGKLHALGVESLTKLISVQQKLQHKRDCAVQLAKETKDHVKEMSIEKMEHVREMGKDKYEHVKEISIEKMEHAKELGKDKYEHAK